MGYITLQSLMLCITQRTADVCDTIITILYYAIANLSVVVDMSLAIYKIHINVREACTCAILCPSRE